jgi:hypothetical protein
MKWALVLERNKRKKGRYTKTEIGHRQSKKAMREKGNEKDKKNSLRIKQMYYQIAGLKPEIDAILSGNGGCLSNL